MLCLRMMYVKIILENQIKKYLIRLSKKYTVYSDGGPIVADNTAAISAEIFKNKCSFIVNNIDKHNSFIN